MLNIIDSMGKVTDNIKNFMINNSDNVLLWIILFFGGMAVFFMTFKALSKDK